MDTQKAIELLEKSEHIAIVLPSQPTLDHLVSAEVLAQILTARQKHIGFLTSLPKEALPQSDFFKHIYEAKPLLREFIVSIDTISSPLSQLRYEKGEDKIDVILSPKNSPFKKEAISFKSGELQCDAAIMLGITDPESLTQDTLEAEFLTNTPLLNIDYSPENKNYGEINLLDTEKISLSELVYSLISAFDPSSLTADKTTLLLAGITEQTRSFSTASTNANTLLTASELMRLGARLPVAQELNRNSLPLSLAQLTGRATVRSKINEDSKVLWSFITAEDYEKTGRSTADIPVVLDNLQKNLPPGRVLVLLSQQPEDKTVSATLAGELTILEKIHNQELAEFQSPHLLLAKTFSAFQEAEEYVASLIRNLL